MQKSFNLSVNSVIEKLQIYNRLKYQSECVFIRRIISKYIQPDSNPFSGLYFNHNLVEYALVLSR